VENRLKNYPLSQALTSSQLKCLSKNIKPPGHSGNISTDNAPELSRHEAHLQSRDSITAQQNASVVSWRIQWNTCFDFLCSLKNAGWL